MNILVLGGGGFIGSHIVEALVGRGEDVRVFDRAASGAERLASRVDWRVGDFNDERQMDSALEGVDAVIHAISSTTPATSNENPVADVERNLIGTLKLLDLMGRRNIKRILFLSSGGTVYGEPEVIPVREDAPLQPICSYGVVKVSIEKYLLMYQRLHGFRPVILRPSNPYGPGQGRTQGAIAEFARRMMRNEPIVIWGDGGNVRDYLPVSDLAELCVRAMLGGECGIYNAGSGKGHSLNEVLSLMAGITGTAPKVQYRPARPFDVRSIVLDVRRAWEDFGWKVDRTLEEGLSEYWRELTGGAS